MKRKKLVYNLLSMGLKFLAAILFLLTCFQIGHADTLTLTSAGGETSGGEYVYPYYFTVSGSGGTSTLVAMSCIDVAQVIGFGESWQATVVNVSSVSPSGMVAGESGLDILADAYLYNQYAGANGNGYIISDIQWAIWSILDPSGVAGNSAFTPNAQALAAGALSIAPTLPSSYFSNDVLFLPIDGTQTSGYGEPQMLLTSPPPPAITPEPISLILLGTGMLGVVAIRRRSPYLSTGSKSTTAADD